MTDTPEPTVEYDVDELLNGNADSVIAKLANLSNAELETAKKAEAAQVRPRSTVIAAIDAELAGRPADPAPADPAVAAAADAASSAQAERIAALEADLAQRDERIAELEGLNTAAGEEIAALRQAATAKAPKAPKPAKAKQLGIAEELAIDDEARVYFVDADDCTLPDLPALVFAGWQFAKDGGSAVVLNEGIGFDPGRPQTDIAAAFVTVDGKTGWRAPLAVPITVGGGKAMSVPAGHLRFSA